jgi:hypothetical protein
MAPLKYNGIEPNKQDEIHAKTTTRKLYRMDKVSFFFFLKKKKTSARSQLKIIGTIKEAKTEYSL